MGTIEDIQDDLPIGIRQKCFDKHYELIKEYAFEAINAGTKWYQFMERFFFNKVLWPKFEKIMAKFSGSLSEDYFKGEGVNDPGIPLEMIVNGEIIYG